jgi:hypothetical protein
MKSGLAGEYKGECSSLLAFALSEELNEGDLKV